MFRKQIFDSGRTYLILLRQSQMDYEIKGVSHAPRNPLAKPYEHIRSGSSLGAVCCGAHGSHRERALRIGGCERQKQVMRTHNGPLRASYSISQNLWGFTVPLPFLRIVCIALAIALSMFQNATDPRSNLRGNRLIFSNLRRQTCQDGPLGEGLRRKSSASPWSSRPRSAR